MGHHFCPSGLPSSSLDAIFAPSGLVGSPILPQGILRPLLTSSDLVATCKGIFLFIPINYEPFRVGIPPQETYFSRKHIHSPIIRHDEGSQKVRFLIQRNPVLVQTLVHPKGRYQFRRAPKETERFISKQRYGASPRRDG